MAAALGVILLTAGSSAPSIADTNESATSAVAQGEITGAQYHACAIVDGPRLKCWGNNNNGQLGYGDEDFRGATSGGMGVDLPSVDLGTGRTPVSVSAGGSHTCAILDDGQVKCWGDGRFGMLGYGDTGDRGDEAGEMGDDLPTVDLGTGRTAVALAAAFFHTCALLDDGTVKCWGSGLNGRLGQGDTQNRGDEPGEMGDDLPAVDLGTGRTAVAISTSYDHACAVLDDGTVKCWGSSGADGRLGYGANNSRGDAAGEMGDDLPAVNLGVGRTAVVVSAGGAHSCALLDDGQVKCWGDGGFGQTGQGNTDDLGTAAHPLTDSVPTIDLGTGRSAVAVTAGSQHTCARLDDDTLKCWGQPFRGQVGLGDDVIRGDDPGEMGDDLPTVDLGTGRTVAAVTTGEQFTCARLDDGELKCWGDGTALGYPTLNDRGAQPGQMGDDLPAVDLGDPTVTITEPADGASFVRGQVVTVDYACADDTTVVACTGDVDDGDTLDTATAGAQTFTVTAIDDGGNETTVIHDFVVAESLCAGRVADVVLALGEEPTSGPDVIVGTAGPDTINALGGNDVVCGRGGDDVIQGGPGRDSLFGGNGEDTLRAGAGPGGGVLGGNAGDDVLVGGAGNDTLRGGLDDDTITGRGGNDLANGGPGTDTCSLTPGVDTATDCEA